MLETDMMRPEHFDRQNYVIEIANTLPLLIGSISSRVRIGAQFVGTTDLAK